jgi:membrane protein DedA with SNARE-associated domain
MAFGRFVAMATIGSIVWISALGILGNAVGAQWQTWKHHLDYVDYVGIAVIVVLLAWGLYRWIRHARAENRVAASAPERAVDVARD